jgi:hypothetical protein
MAGVQFLTGARGFSVFHIVQTAVGPTQPTIQWVPGGISTAVKRLGREADQSPPSSAELKNGGAIPPLLGASTFHDA